MPLTIAIMLFAWSAAYALIIRRAALDKKHGMPFPVNCLNWSWEGMMLIVHEPGSAAWFAVGVWFLLDCVVLLQYFLYAPPRTVRSLADRLFWPGSLAILAVGVATPVVMVLRFEDFQGMITAYFNNALMSILFCFMIVGRNSLKGQSFYIALAKFIGTFVVIGHGDLQDIFIIWCYIVVMFFDLAYIGLVIYVSRRDRLPILTRF